MSFSMPYGYSGRTITEDALKAKHTFNRLHPEMQRRFLGLSKALAAKGVPLGVGTGWRVQPTGKRGFASPGNSWHEGVPVEAQANALAIDAVPSSSFNAMEMELPKFHLRSFRHVNNEPWHIQLAEIPAGRHRATHLPHIGRPVIPGDTPTAAPSWTPNVPLPTLRIGSHSLRVIHLQNVMNFWHWGNVGNADGDFGQRTADGVKAMQHALHVGADGVYGARTRDALRQWLIGLHNMG